jgi:probable phosphoglycerate mutase
VTQIWLVRHGATQWSLAGRHTGLTDLPLTPEGEAAARSLAPRLAGVRFDLVLTSPLQRARRTAELAGFADAEVEPLVVEWDYGQYEGLTRAQIREQVPNWSPWGHPAMPGGEHLDDVAKRADAVLERCRSGSEAARDGDREAGEGGRVLVFAHGHFLRVLGARYIGQPARLAEHLALDPATVSVLAPDRGTPTIDSWNAAVIAATQTS